MNTINKQVLHVTVSRLPESVIEELEAYIGRLNEEYDLEFDALNTIRAIVIGYGAAWDAIQSERFDVHAIEQTFSIDTVSRKALIEFVKEHAFESNFARQLWLELESGAFPTTESEGEVVKLQEERDEANKEWEAALEVCNQVGRERDAFRRERDEVRAENSRLRAALERVREVAKRSQEAKYHVNNYELIYKVCDQALYTTTEDKEEQA